jgi:S1-C subfamily serine protease
MSKEIALRQGTGWIAAMLALAALLAGCGGGDDKAGTPARSAPAIPARDATAVQESFVRVVRLVSPQVVQIQTSSGLGSGVVFDASGDIVTNNHVVGRSRSFTVTMSNGHTSGARIVGTFPPEDLAVIRLQGSRPGPASFADSSKLQVGQFAFAIGNPLGLRSSVTQGIVSSLGRTVSEGPGGGVISSAIQTSAPINHGNSGGALVDVDGQVIGIPTLAATDPSLGGAAAPGIGFAIPSNTVRRIAGQIVRSGRVTRSGRAYLGVRVASAPGAPGVVVAGVEPGGPAAKAGIRAGELIVSVAGTPTPTTDALAAALAGLRPGQRTTVGVVAPDGARRSVRVTLGQLPAT